MILRQIVFGDKPCSLACDAQCHKAWGLTRPSEQLSEDEDDYVMLADQELGEAPICNGEFEGGQSKPQRPEDRLNKWCARQCERSVLVSTDKGLVELPDWSKRRFNQPWKHTSESSLRGE